MHSQLALTEHASPNLAPLILLDPVHGPEGSDEPSQPRIAAWIEKDEVEEGEECVLPSASSSSPLGDGRRFASPHSQAQDAFALHRSHGRQEQEAL